MSEAQLDAALVLLCDIDSYMDFGTPLEPGPDGGANFEDVTGINEVWERCRFFLAFMPDDVKARVDALRASISKAADKGVAG